MHSALFLIWETGNIKQANYLHQTRKKAWCSQRLLLILSFSAQINIFPAPCCFLACRLRTCLWTRKRALLHSLSCHRVLQLARSGGLKCQPIKHEISRELQVESPLERQTPHSRPHSRTIPGSPRRWPSSRSPTEGPSRRCPRDARGRCTLQNRSVSSLGA